MQPTGAAPQRNRLVSGLFRFLMTLLVLGLLGLVGYLASERNARTFTLAVHEDQLVVHKGRKLPVGTEPWRPEDPTLAEAYAPVPLHGQQPSQTLLEQTYPERDELDRALFDFLERMARPRISSEDAREQERGVYFLRRAALLQGLNSTQRETLRAMQSQVAWYQARLKLEQARQLVTEAMAQLDLAMQARDPNSQRARELAGRLASPARELEVALRRALGGMGADVGSTPARHEGEQHRENPTAPSGPNGVEPSRPSPSPDSSEGGDANGGAASGSPESRGGTGGEAGAGNERAPNMP